MRLNNDQRIQEALTSLYAAVDEHFPPDEYDAVQASARLHQMGLEDPLESHRQMHALVEEAIRQLSQCERQSDTVMSLARDMLAIVRFINVPRQRGVPGRKVLEYCLDAAAKYKGL